MLFVFIQHRSQLPHDTIETSFDMCSVLVHCRLEGEGGVRQTAGRDLAHNAARSPILISALCVGTGTRAAATLPASPVDRSMHYVNQYSNAHDDGFVAQCAAQMWWYY